MMVRFDLVSALSCPVWASVLNTMTSYDIRYPAELSAVSRADLIATAALLPEWGIYLRFGRMPAFQHRDRGRLR